MIKIFNRHLAGTTDITLVQMQQKTLLPTAVLLLGDFAICTGRIENTIPSGTPNGYSA
jgi:hypothetical protein